MKKEMFEIKKREISFHEFGESYFSFIKFGEIKAEKNIVK